MNTPPIKILIVTRSFWPVIAPRSFRATALAKEFAREGHVVTVITPRRDGIHDDFEMQYGVSIVDLGRSRWDTLPSRRSMAGSFLTRATNRFLKLAFEYPDIQLLWMVRKALKGFSGYDLLISIAAPHPVHWGVSWAWDPEHPIARTWVADCGDPYMGCTNPTFKPWPYFSIFEKSFMRKTDYVTIPIGQKLSDYYEEFHEKIRVIPQGFDIDKDQSTLPTYRKNDIPNFAFAGSFNFGMRDPRPLLDLLCKNEQDFRFYVFSSNSKLIRDYVSRMNGKLVLSGVIPRDELLPKLATMDFLIHLENNNAWEQPSKLIDYSIVGRPILSIGKSLDERSVQDFFKGDYTGARPFQNLDNFRIQNVASRFLELTRL